jgi:predicted DNA-binding transcriptional regulator AlpA
MRKYNGRLRRDPSYFKPKKFKHYKTRKEVAVLLGVDESWLYKREKDGTIPSPARIKRGLLEIRLYSPEVIDEIAKIKAKIKPGPKKGKAEGS